MLSLEFVFENKVKLKLLVTTWKAFLSNKGRRDFEFLSKFIS